MHCVTLHNPAKDLYLLDYLAILWLLGIYAIIFGLLFLVRAFQWRSWASSFAVKAS